LLGLTAQETGIRAAEPDHAKAYAYIPQKDRAKRLRDWAEVCSCTAILKEGQQVTRRFFLKTTVPNLLFQNRWNVYGACQSF